jgi:hypothetical protein
MSLIYDIVIRKQIPGASLQRGFSTLNSSYVIFNELYFNFFIWVICLNFNANFVA